MQHAAGWQLLLLLLLRLLLLRLTGVVVELDSVRACIWAVREGEVRGYEWTKLSKQTTHR